MPIDDDGQRVTDPGDLWTGGRSRADLATYQTLRGAGDEALHEVQPAADPPDQAPAAVDQGAVAGRYEPVVPLGRGGMGVVWRATDTVLHRDVALKVLRPELLFSARALQRFEEEAKVTAQLQHPSIVPIFDLGRLDDGRVWFTMREVRGRTLEVLLQQVHEALDAGAEATDDGFSLRRLIDAVHRVCEAVAYAHARGVVHRDLKPSNIMIGGYGEVQVLDWGLAKVLSQSHEAPEGPVRGHRPEGAQQTRQGSVTGTPAYMAPEQARGETDRIGPGADVHALGATLYDVLTGQPPHGTDSVSEALARVASGAVVPPPSACTAYPVDAELDRITARALAHEVEDRYVDAGALAAELGAWLDGARRRARAREVVAQAEAVSTQAAAASTRAALLGAQAERALAEVPTEAGESARWPAWDLEDEARAAGQLALELKDQAMTLFRGALTHDPQLAEAHASLASALQRQHQHLEESGDHGAARRLGPQLRAHDRGRFSAYLAGDGALTLVTDPPGAEVRLHRVETRRRRRVPVFERILGTTPLRAVALPMGNYVCTLHLEEHTDVTYPVRIDRQQHWDGVRPGDDLPVPIRLPAVGELGPDDCYVPAGRFWSSADLPVLSEPYPRRFLWCDGFVIKRHPVTNGQFLAFLNGLVDVGREADAEAWAPAAVRRQQPAWLRDSNGWYALGADSEGHMWEEDMPVVSVKHSAAVAFAAANGWRLPWELEWEKSCRGVDERAYPWGSSAEVSRARMRDSTGPAGPRPWHDCLDDVSPYGVVGMAGNVADWVVDPVDAVAVDGERVVAPTGVASSFRYRGGDWLTAPYVCRADFRRQRVGELTLDSVGFRVARRFL